MKRALTLAVAVLALSPSASPAADAAPTVAFTAHDVADLLKATQDVEASPKITVDLFAKTAAEMPPYDPVAHFAGIEPKSGAALIWILKSAPPKSDATVRALRAAVELACMATGFAGPKWKTIYDQVAAADAAQPAGAPNPYRYRLALTQRIQAIVDSYAAHR